MSTSQIGPNTSTKKQKKQKQPRNGNGGADDVVVATDKLLLELVLTSMCITVDHVSAAVKSVCIQTSLEEHDEEKQGEESGDASLCQIYRDTLWKYPIECALHAVNTWSLQQFGMRRKRGLQRGFPCPVDAANEVSAAETGEQEQQEVDDQQQERKSVRLRRLPYASPYPKHRHVDTRGIPDALRITRIEEDPLEARWDASGTPVPLRESLASMLTRGIGGSALTNLCVASSSAIWNRSQHSWRTVCTPERSAAVPGAAFQVSHGDLPANEARSASKPGKPRARTHPDVERPGKAEEAAGAGWAVVPRVRVGSEIRSPV